MNYKKSVKIKGITVAALVALMLAAVFTCLSYASEKSISVYVSISDGTNYLSMEKIAVSDVDEDGKLTVYDALLCTHNEKFEGGAAEGFSSSIGAYGPFITKLWGIENGGSCGYYQNNKTPESIYQLVDNGDYIYAFNYTDKTSFSDAYSYFESNTVLAQCGEKITLKATCIALDGNFSAYSAPLENAQILINGAESLVETNGEGEAVISIDIPGRYVITAKSDSKTIVPPVCIVNVSEAPPTGDSVFVYAALLVMSLFGVALTIRKKVCEK